MDDSCIRKGAIRTYGMGDSCIRTCKSLDKIRTYSPGPAGIPGPGNPYGRTDSCIRIARDHMSTTLFAQEIQANTERKAPTKCNLAFLSFRATCSLAERPFEH
jgi:hypothetical protein